MPGYVDPHPYFNSADLYVSSSNYEGVSNATIEAMNYGLPIITSKNQVGMNDYLQHNHNSLIVRNSIDEIYSSMLFLLKNKKLSMKLGYNAKQSTKRFNDNLIEKNWKRLILS